MEKWMASMLDFLGEKPRNEAMEKLFISESEWAKKFFGEGAKGDVLENYVRAARFLLLGSPMELAQAWLWMNGKKHHISHEKLDWALKKAAEELGVKPRPLSDEEKEKLKVLEKEIDEIQA